MIKKFILTFFLVFVQAFVFGATITSTATGGFWSSGSSWVGGIAPSSSDDVVISSGSTVTINADAFAKSLNVSGILTINHSKTLTVYGNVDVVSGAQFNAGTGNSDIALIKVYGNFTNSGTANFWKSTVVIAGDLVTGSTILQNNGEIIVGGNVSAIISGGGNGYVYPVNPNATVSVTGTSNAQVAGAIPTDSGLLSLMYEVIYGGNCPFVGITANVSACAGTNVTFSITFSSYPATGAPTYQWEVNMNNGSGWVSTGVTSANLLLTGVTISMNNYKYRAKITWNGCTKNGNYGVLTVNSAPIADAGLDFTKSCLTNTSGATIGIASVVGTTYIWSPSTGLSSATVSNPTANPTVSTTYMLTSTITSTGCTATDTVVVTVNTTAPTTPTATITQPTCTLATGTIAVNVQNVGETYSFDNGSTFQAGNSKSGLAPGSYNVIIKNSSGCISNATSVTIKNATNTLNGSTWSNGSTPISTENVVFNGNYNSTGDLTACSCTVNPGVYVNINSGNTVTLTNELTVAPSATMTFFNNASLVQINNVSNSGDIDYVRTTNTVVRNTDYTYWSSPVSPQTLGDFSPDTPDGKMYSYNSNVEDWKQEYLSTTMNLGVGYIVRGPEPSGIPLPPSPFTAIFVGEPNNGTISITGISADKSYLLGNPYPSSLDADTFLNDNAGVLNGTLYFWTHKTAIQDANAANLTLGSGAFAYTSDDYATYNATGGVAATQLDIDPLTGLPYPGSAPSGSPVPTGKIAAGQGFFASSLVSPSSTTINFTNTMRVAGNNSQFFKTKNTNGKTAKSIEKNRIWLNLTNKQGAFKQTLVGYVTDATNDYDDRFDGESFDGNEFVDFYSINQDKNLVIQGRALPFDENDEVPLGFRTSINGAFTINIDQVDGLLTNQSVYLEDKMTNTVFDLKRGNYTFNTIPGTFNDRFVLKYSNKTLGTADLDTLARTVLVSNKNKQIKINSSVETIDKVAVYDLLGRQIYQKSNVNNNELLISNLVSSRQVILVKTLLQNGQEVSNKVVY